MYTVIRANTILVYGFERDMNRCSEMRLPQSDRLKSTACMHGLVIRSHRVDFIESDRCLKWYIHRDNNGRTDEIVNVAIDLDIHEAPAKKRKFVGSEWAGRKMGIRICTDEDQVDEDEDEDGVHVNEKIEVEVVKLVFKNCAVDICLPYGGAQGEIQRGGISHSWTSCT